MLPKAWKYGVMRCLFAVRSNPTKALYGNKRLQQRIVFGAQMTIFVAQNDL